MFSKGTHLEIELTRVRPVLAWRVSIVGHPVIIVGKGNPVTAVIGEESGHTIDLKGKTTFFCVALLQRLVTHFILRAGIISWTYVLIVFEFVEGFPLPSLVTLNLLLS